MMSDNTLDTDSIDESKAWEPPALVITLRGHAPTEPPSRFTLANFHEVVIERGDTLEHEVRHEGMRPILAISIPSRSLSRTHARLVKVSGGWRLCDLDSKNGIWIEGGAGDKRDAVLGERTNFVCGDVLFRFLPRLLADPREDSYAFTPRVEDMPLASTAWARQRLFGHLCCDAMTSHPIVLVGATGAGKERLARALHAASKRSGRFVVAAYNGTPILDSIYDELAKDPPGTLYVTPLHDLDDMSQRQLLGLIKGRLSTSNDRVTPVPTRLIVSSNTNLQTLLHRREAPGEKPRLNHALYTMLREHERQVDPLGARGEDLGLFVASWLREWNQFDVRLSPNALSALLVRKRGTTLEGFKAILELALSRARGSYAGKGELLVKSTHIPEKGALGYADALRMHRGNVAAAARELGVERTSFRRQLADFGIEPDAYRD